MMTDIKSPLLGKTLDELQSMVLDLGMPKFTAKSDCFVVIRKESFFY